jgi:hypothetical protein
VTKCKKSCSISDETRWNSTFKMIEIIQRIISNKYKATYLSSFGELFLKVRGIMALFLYHLIKESLTIFLKERKILNFPLPC